MEQDGRKAVCGGKLGHVHDGNDGHKVAVWASGGVDREDPNGQRLERFGAVSDGLGEWTFGLCQTGRIYELGKEDVFGIGEGVARLERLYKPDPLMV
jgi:hypothetical protein